jgi:Fe(3+) dicitrate transport protein
LKLAINNNKHIKTVEMEDRANMKLITILLFPMFAVFGGGVAAQSQMGSLSGNVLDQSGAAVARAVVEMRFEGSQMVRSTQTDEGGSFGFDQMQPGRYSLSAQGTGFEAAVLNFELLSGEIRIAVLTLKVAPISEQVVVNSSSIIGNPDRLPHIPGAVDVITASDLASSNIFTLNEAVRKIAGINARDEEGFGLRPNIGIRGLNPTRSSKVLLLEDGLPLAYAPYGDNASYYHPPVDRFENIEVLKGSGQILYGPVTVGGVMNYITPAPPQKRSGSVALTGGSRDYLNGHIRYGGMWGRTGFLADYMRKQGEGARQNIRSGLDDFTLKSVTNLTPRQILTLKFNYYGETSNITYSGLTDAEYRADPRQNPFRNDYFYGDRWGGAASHSLVLSPGIVLTTSFYANSFNRDWWRQSSNSRQRPNDAVDPVCGGMQNLNTTCGNEGRLRSYFTWGIESRARANHRVLGLTSEAEFGARFHSEIQDRRQQNGAFPTSRSGILVEDNERRNRAFSAFLQNRFIVGKWAMVPGLRVERIYFKRINRLTDASGETDMTQPLPGFGVTYSPASHTTFLAGVHRGFAPPRTEDVISNTGGTVELDPELSWNYEAGFRSAPKEGLRFEGMYFRMDYENQIVPASLAGGVGATLTNAGETLHQGIELTARIDTGILFGWRHNLYGRVASTYIPVSRYAGQRFSSVPGFSNVSVSGNRLPYAPELLNSIGLGYVHPRGLELFVEAVQTSGQFTDDLNTVDGSPDGQRGRIPGQLTWNASASYGLETIGATVFITAKNILDRTQIVDRSRGLLPNTPRIWQSGIRFDF